MAYYPSNCDANIPSHGCDPCEQREYGRIRSAGFIHKDYVFSDPTMASDWITGIDAKSIILIPETNGSLAAGAAKLGPGYGETTETLLGYDFTAKFNDPNYVSNAEFYNALVGNRNYKFFYRTSSHVHITNNTVTIIPNTEIKDDLNGEVVWMNEVKWIDNQFATPIASPDGVFDTCYIA
jgi:hypothetical protein